MMLVVAAWCVGLAGPYQFDDHITPVDDPASQSLAAFVTELPRTLRPATKLTYAIEASVGVDGPAERRAVSIAMLAVAAIALAGLLRAVVPGARVAALVAAIVFVAHPVHAEGVLAVTGRDAVLAMACVLAALLALARDRPRLAGAIFLVAMLARETAIAAAFPIAVLELTRPGSTWRAAASRLAPCGAALALASLWLVLTPRYHALAHASFTDARGVGTAQVAQVGAIFDGISLYVRPGSLTLDHGEPIVTRVADPRFLLGGLALVGAAIACVLAIRARDRATAIGAALWLAAIVPTQTLVPKLDPLTERPLELGLAGIALVACGVAATLARRWRGVRRPTYILAGALAVALVAATIARARTYRSELALWRDAATKSEANPRPHYNYGIVLEHAGLRDEALIEMRRADALRPFDPDTQRAIIRLTPP